MSSQDVVSVVGDRLAQGLVRRFLQDTHSRWRRSRSQFERFHWHGVRNMRAAGRVLSNVVRSLRPSLLAHTHFVTEENSVRLNVALLKPLGGTMPAPHEVAAQIYVERVTVAPRDGTFVSSRLVPLAFTRHCLQRIVQRSVEWKNIRQELIPALCVGGPLLWELAVQSRFQQLVLLAHSGIFAGALDEESERFVLTTFLPINSAARQRSDLVTELAGMLWLPEADRYLDFLPAALDPRPGDDSFLPIFEIYLKHAELLRRPHEPGVDWFALARDQANSEA